MFYFELTLPNGSAAQLLDVMDYISNRYVVPVVMLILFLTSTGFWNLLFRH